MKGNLLPFNLKTKIEAYEPYQITFFVSENLTKVSDINIHSFPDVPSVVNSFYENRECIHSIQNQEQSIYSSLESIVIFYPNTFNEVELFINFWYLENTVRKTAKCLIIYLSNNFTHKDEIYLINVLKYAWKKTFLDFSVQVENLKKKTDSSYWIYHFNPFSELIYRNFLHDDYIEIFPDKIKNAHKFPLYISNPEFSSIAVRTARKPDRQYHFSTTDYYVLNFVAKIINLNVVTTNLPVEWFLDSNYLMKYNFDLHGIGLRSADYEWSFLIPKEIMDNYIVAFVPIIPASRLDTFLRMFNNLLMMCFIIFSFLFFYNYFHSKLRQFKTSEVLQILLGQSIRQEPKKIVTRIIMITLMMASFIFLNDIFFEIISMAFEKKEIPFDTYEDLNNAKLQTYTNQNYLTDPRFQKNNIQDPNLLKVLNKTVTVDSELSFVSCLATLKNWKNVSCIGAMRENLLSQYLDLNGQPTMKVAKPPIFAEPSGFYWFSKSSVYAMKFHEIMRRIRETSLMHWPMLVAENRSFVDFKEPEKDFDKIKTEHVLIVLTVGYSIAAIIFIMELILFNVKVRRNYLKR